MAYFVYKTDFFFWTLFPIPPSLNIILWVCIIVLSWSNARCLWKLLSATPYLYTSLYLLIPFNLLSKIGKKRFVYRKRRKFYSSQFDKNKSLSKERFLGDESSIQSTVSSADVTNVVDSLSDVVGPSVSTKKIKIDSSNPKATKKGLVP